VLKFKWVSRIRTRFLPILHRGADHTPPSPISDFFASVAELCLLLLNTLVSVAILPWSSKPDKPKRRGPPSDVIWATLDADFRYVDMSPEFSKLLGFTRSQLIGRGVDYVTPEDFVDIDAFIAEVRRVRMKMGFWVYQCQDGATFPVLYRMEIRPDNTADVVITPLNSPSQKMKYSSS
jgi:PAS domain S-box-containing protein